jgi:hypothetical protein
LELGFLGAEEERKRAALAAERMSKGKKGGPTSLNCPHLGDKSGCTDLLGLDLA